MELLLLLMPVLVVLGLCAALVRRRQQAQAWDRELEQAFGVTGHREIPPHRAL